MLRSLLLPALASAVVIAQDPNPDPGPLRQAAERLHKCLATTAALDRCAFTAEWGAAGQVGQPKRADGDSDSEKDGENGDPRMPPGVARMVFGELAAGTAKGTWSSTALHTSLGDDELLVVGRRMLARDATVGWTARNGRFADGNRVRFLPDPVKLLEALRAMDLGVVHRQVATLDDRPIEILSATLDQDQATRLLWDGLLPESVVGGPFAQMLVGGPQFGAGAVRPAAPKPDLTVDVAFHVDPGTGLVHRLHLRSWRKDQGQNVFGGQVVFVGGGAVTVTGGGDDGDDKTKDDETEPADRRPGQPLRYADGLPQRPRKAVRVDDYVLDLRDHGVAAMPEFDGAAAELLRGR